MVSKPVAHSMLLLRIVALAASAVTVAILVTDKVNFNDGTSLTFRDFNSYWYELVVAAIAGAYCIVQLPFAIYHSVHGKRFIRNQVLPEFDFHGDKVITYLVASGIGAGFAVTLEFKKFFDRLFDLAGTPKKDPTRSTTDKFFVRAIIASSVLIVAFLAMAIVSAISSINRSKSKSKGIFG
ncbi:hypothetical protein RJT34_25995 [Clitoria ternatea]|uniref:CASP-like protein n=1 Tax=Clitoria ternatea TaxID=43366 RepID=A0AAN9F655_CLITE